MRQFVIAKLRERTTRNISLRRFKSNVALQLDYYMSPQFAGVAAALVNGGYDSFDMKFLPICPVGEEQACVRDFQDNHPTSISIGSVEQNIFIPTLCSNPGLKVKAIASMFRQSPLCIASMDSKNESGMKIGAHEDTVELLQRLFPKSHVVASPRASKISDLVAGEVDAIQAYLTTEVPTLRRSMNGDPVVTTLEGLDGAKLGYSQMLFATEESLAGDRRDTVKAFLNATFDGWKTVIENPVEGVKMVQEAKKMLGLSDESNDHWHHSPEYELEMLKLCNEFVKETFEGGRLGVICPARWNKASKWLMDEVQLENNFGLDPSVWHLEPHVLSGNELARNLMENTKQSAMEFKKEFDRMPSLVVITVGELSRYTHAERRLQKYSSSSNSWFSKTKTGEANGFSVQEINLGANTTTEQLLSAIYALQDVDGIQLMWPLPDHIDAPAVYNAIAIEKDVDGIHYVGQQEIRNKAAFPPVTPAAVMTLLSHHAVDLKNQRVLITGRSPIVGSPLANMVREAGGIVTVAHSGVSRDKLEELARGSDIVLTCAGQPGALKAEWIENAVLINVGTTFLAETDSLHADVEGEMSGRTERFSPVPGGVGPLSLPMLFGNVVQAAWANMKGKGTVAKTWTRHPASLQKTYHFDSYTEAVAFATKLDGMSTVMDHHANMNIVHKCTRGVDMTLEFYTYEANNLTEKDYEAAMAVDSLSEGGMINMNDYTYSLHPESIAIYPASPRGSSKLLQVDEKGSVIYHSNFSDAFPSIAAGAHIVFNESRVLDARLFLQNQVGGVEIEMMILDMGGIDVDSPCRELILDTMIRTNKVIIGDIYDISGGEKVEVVGIKGVWHEDEKSNGDGMECKVKILSDVSLKELLEKVGTVPIPPYFQRVAEATDKESYNTVYAAELGRSVAAPTAGLHFTDATMKEIGAENFSFLSLHVGAGTFQPVVSSDARDHEMHQEVFSVSVLELKRVISALKEGKPIMAVGTTSTRTLESLYWCGVKKIRGFETDLSKLMLDQFEWIPLSVGEGKYITRDAALQALVNDLDDHDVLRGKTGLMITPNSYEFKVIDHLVTNFHAPDSTLMLLVSSFLGGGEKVRSVYEAAQSKGFRFLSYGDACVFSKPRTGNVRNW